MANTILGFDFGNHSMKIAKVSGSDVLRTASVPLPDNLVRDGVIVSYDAMADVIREALKKNRFGTAEAAVVLPPRCAILRRFTVPLMTVDQLSMNLPFEFHDFLDMDKDKYYYDYIVNEVIREDDPNASPDAVSEGALTGPRMDLTAAAVPKDVIKEYKDMFRCAGIKLATAIPVECAYANLLNAANVSENRETCIINLDYNASTVHIFKGSVFQTTRVKEAGINDVEEQIADHANCDIHVARERLFANYNNVQEDDDVLTVFNAIAADVRKTINFYKFSNRESDFSEAFVHGCGASIPPFIDAVATTADLRLRSLSEMLPTVRDLEGDAAMFAAAIGAALQ